MVDVNNVERLVEFTQFTVLYNAIISTVVYLFEISQT